MSSVVLRSVPSALDENLRAIFQKARAKTEHAQETDETFDKDFNGTGLG